MVSTSSRGIDSLEALLPVRTQCHQCFHGFLFLLTVNVQAAGQSGFPGSACGDLSGDQCIINGELIF